MPPALSPVTDASFPQFENVPAAFIFPAMPPAFAVPLTVPLTTRFLISTPLTTPNKPASSTFVTFNPEMVKPFPLNVP